MYMYMSRYNTLTLCPLHSLSSIHIISANCSYLMMININTDGRQFTLYCYIYMHNSIETYRKSKENNYLASIAA
jgi:hypothetical protein